MLAERKEAMDEGEEAIEKAEDKERELARLFEKFKDNIAYNKEGKMIYQVNGLLAEGGKFDDPVVMELSEELHDQLSKIEETKIPLQWYAFEIALQKLANSIHRSVVSREECDRIAQSLQLDVDETSEHFSFFQI